MSERGSFVTEFIYCKKCLQVILDTLPSDSRRILWQQLSTPQRDEIPIVAGFIRGSYGGEEIHIIEYEIAQTIQRKLCHPVTFCVIPDSGTPEVITISPLE